MIDWQQQVDDIMNRRHDGDMQTAPRWREIRHMHQARSTLFGGMWKGMLLPDEFGHVLASMSKPSRRERLPLERRGRLGNIFHVRRAKYQILVNPIHTPEGAQKVGNIAPSTRVWLL